LYYRCEIVGRDDWLGWVFLLQKFFLVIFCSIDYL